MILTIKNKTFFFIHIPKCGGTSISDSLSKKENNFYQFNSFRHNNISEDLKHIEEKKLNLQTKLNRFYPKYQMLKKSQYMIYYIIERVL